MRIGKVFGIPLILDPSFFVGIVFITLINHRYFDGSVVAKLAWSLLVTLTVFSSVTLHELGHCWAAKKDGQSPVSITLYLIGGVARLRGLGRTPQGAALIAVSGPLVSLLLAIGFLLLSPSPEGNLVRYVEFGALINMAITFFNMLPILPLDGGRLAVAGLWALKGTSVGMQNFCLAMQQCIKLVSLPALSILVFCLIASGNFSIWNGMLLIYVGITMRGEYRFSTRLLRKYRDKTVEIFMSPLPDEMKSTAEAGTIHEAEGSGSYYPGIPRVPSDRAAIDFVLIDLPQHLENAVSWVYVCDQGELLGFVCLDDLSKQFD